MAGSPKKRDRIERLKASGEITTPNPEEVPVQDVVIEPVKKKHPGQSAEFMREMTRKRLEAGKTDPSKLGGRPRTRRKKSEVEEDAIAKLIPKALQVLADQLYSDDETIAARAAVKVLEYGKGKPATSIKVEGEQVHTLRYETVVMLPGDVIEQADAEEVFDDLLQIEQGEVV